MFDLCNFSEFRIFNTSSEFDIEICEQKDRIHTYTIYRKTEFTIKNIPENITSIYVYNPNDVDIKISVYGVEKWKSPEIF